MHLLSVERLSKSYGEKILFADVSFGVAEGDRIGFIGVNGTGKSSLLKVIAGIDQQDSGTVTVVRSMVIRMLSQEPIFRPEETALEHVLGGDSEPLRVLSAYQHVLTTMENGADDPHIHHRLLTIQSKMDELYVWSIESEAKAALSKLGIDDYHQKVSQMSGGQRKRVAMAAVLLQPSDILILDEPTNHIDHESVIWMEAMLQKRKGALLMVTHDRYVLDRVCNRVIELDRGSAYFYEANYSRFIELKIEREEREASSEAKRQNLLRNELAWIRRGAKARTTKQKARIDRFEQLQERQPKQSGGKVEISIASSRLGKKIVEIENLCKSFAGRKLIQDFQFIAVPGERIGIIGRNGSGKSTLLKLIAGKLEADKGLVDIGPTVQFGWFGQEFEEMDPTMRVIEYIREVADQVRTADGAVITVGQMLERFLFSSTMQWTLIEKLSGGEKRRLQLLRVLIQSPNVLMLDEPTNDLDIATLTVLEDYLDDFPGVVFVVSHDRYFLDRVVDRILSLNGEGEIQNVIGNFSEYEETLRRQAIHHSPNSDDRTQSLSTKPVSTGNAKNSDKPRAVRMTYKEQKEYEQIEGLIEEAESELRQVTEQMERNGLDAMELNRLLQQQIELQEKVDTLILRWTELSELAGN
jgi:ATP-binding cassette subfamily F protein uup